MELVVQHVEGCPNAAVAMGGVREALRETDLGDVEVLVQRVDYDGKAETISITFRPSGIRALANEQSTEVAA